MIINEDTVLIGSKVVLVPYLAAHVTNYHEWMQSEMLQELTASEPLTIEEEYAMQKSWHTDKDKCTFIVLDADAYERGGSSDIVSSMIGDVNIFIIDHEDEQAAEVEVMIAVDEYRKKGCGRESVRMMLSYAQKTLGITKFVAKIGLKNDPSIRLFRSLLFVQESVSEVFQEVTMVLNVSRNAVAKNLDTVTYMERSLKGITIADSTEDTMKTKYSFGCNINSQRGQIRKFSLNVVGLKKNIVRLQNRGVLGPHYVQRDSFRIDFVHYIKLRVGRCTVEYERNTINDTLR
eukprot:CFRG7972T1